MPELFKNYIEGQWVESGSKKTFRVVNPADTDDVIGEFVESTREDCRGAIAAAQRAFPAWSAVPAPERARFVSRAIEVLRQRKDDIARALCREEGKILREAAGEVMKGINLLEFYAGEGFRIEGKTLPSEMPNTFVYTVRRPLGVVSLISPWNFPFAIPAWKIAPAIVAGNTVVFKPSDFAPHSSWLLTQVFHDVGLPAGVLNYLNGPGPTVGDEMIRNPHVKAVSFTGSNAVGEAINRAASERGIKVCLEMGGKNAAVVLDDANLDLAVTGVFQGAFGSTGQRCTATSRLIVTRGIKEQLMDRLLELVARIKVGPGLDPDSTMGPLVNGNQLESVMAHVEKGKSSGAKLLCGGGRPETDSLRKGHFVEPTVFADVDPSSSLWQEEIFGPVLSVATADDAEHALRLANDSRFGLTSAIYTESVAEAMRFVEGIETGMTHVNSPTVGGEAQLPFGGIKATGVGDREMAQEGINFFTELKTVFLDFTGKPRQSSIY